MCQSRLQLHLHRVNRFVTNLFLSIYFRKTKPEFCPDCSCHLQGTYVSKKMVPCDHQDSSCFQLAPGVYSHRYHQHFRFFCLFPSNFIPQPPTFLNIEISCIFQHHIQSLHYRCLVEPGDDEVVSKCSFPGCMENRRLAILNREEFTCKHLSALKKSMLDGSVQR